MFTIEYKGYKISQSSNNHISIFKDGKMVFHASCSVKYKEEIMKLFVDKYMWKPNTFGITEESHELLEVNAQVIMTDQDYMKKIGGK